MRRHQLHRAPGRRALLRAALGVACLALLPAIGATPAAGAPERPPRGGDVIEGQYIVVFDDSVRNVSAKTNQRERGLGFRARLRYRHAIRGFAAKLSPGQVRRLRSDPEVDFVSPDRRVEAVGEVPLAPGEPTPPTGIRRILAGTEITARQHSAASVAVLDTGIQLSHPDLSAKDGTNCIEPDEPDEPAEDDHGHGTHVAGTIAAENNGFGVVGVAPGTDVYAVKVLDDEGEGKVSEVVCGIDWVTANHAALGIRVANMSLGGPGDPVEPCESTDDPEHKAICKSTEAGVTYVVAAGNGDPETNLGWDFDFEPQPDLPAAYPEVLTVTAMSDSDGLAGGFGAPPSCNPGEEDDAAATFSSFAATPEGEAHTIAAPGVCIRSTFPGGGYAIGSGTSMASPHVAGIVALCIDEAGVAGPCASLTPAEVIDHLRADAEDYNTANPEYGFAGDPITPLPDRYYGFLTRALPPAPAEEPAGDDPAEGDPADGDDSSSDPSPTDPPLAVPSNRFSFGKLILNRRRGTARQRVRVPGAGRVILRRNKRVRRFARQPDRAGVVALRVRPRGQARRRLNRARPGDGPVRVRVRLRVTFNPEGAPPRTRVRRVRLVRRP